MKKKVLSLLLSATMAVGMLAGCGSSKEAAAPKEEAKTEAPAEEKAADIRTVGEAVAYLETL